MDKLAVLSGSVVTAATSTFAVMRVGTPEAVVAALFLAGAFTGAVSRTYQSEFLDAWTAGSIGFALAVTAISFGLGGIADANELYGTIYNFGLVVWVAAVAFSPVPALVAAAGGGFGARVQYAVRRLVERA